MRNVLECRMAFTVLFIGLFLPGLVNSGLLISHLDLIDNCQSFETGSDLSYNWVLPRLGNDVKFIKFEVRAEHGALIGLSRQNMVLDAMYEIEIGADFNSRTVIRRCHQCPPTATDSKPGRLSGGTARVFWVLFYQGIVAVGSDNSLDPFLVWIDRHPLEINHIGFTTNGVGGWWKFSKLPGTFTSTTTGDACILYPFLKLPIGNFEINFSVKWTGTAAVQLAEEEKSENCYYIVLTHKEYDLGAEIRINDQTVLSTTYSPTQSMESEGPVDFYVKLENSKLSFGEKYLEPILELPGVNATYLQLLGYSSFISDSADWYFPDMIPDVVGYTEVLSELEDCLRHRDIQVFYTDGVSPSMFAVHGYTIGEYELHFKLRAEGRARIMLTDSPLSLIDSYNIVFDDGSDSDNISTSYISLHGEVLQSIHEDTLSGSTNKPFYIRYAQETLSVGHAGETPMLSVGGVPYEEVQYVRFQTEGGEKGRWTFYEVRVKSTVGEQTLPQDTHVYSYHTLGTPEPIYPFAPLSHQKFEFTFDVQAEGDAFVSLSPLPIDQKSYMFFFGLTINGQTSSLVQYDGKILDKDDSIDLSGNAFTKLYIRREDSVLLAGKVGEDPLLEIQGVAEPAPRFINFGNLNGEATKWRFYNVSPAAGGEVSIYLHATDEPVYDLQISPGDFTFIFSAMVTDVTHLFFSPEPTHEPGVGYMFIFTNSDSLGTSRIDVAHDGVAIASYSGNRLNLGDRAYLFVKLVDSTLSLGISGEDTPLLHLFDVDRASLMFIGLQRTTIGVDLWTFFGLKYVGEEGRDDGIMVTDIPSSTPAIEPELPGISTESTQPEITGEPLPDGNGTAPSSGEEGQLAGNPEESSGSVSDVDDPRYNPYVEMSGDSINVTTDGISGYINKMGPLELTTGSRGQFSVKAEKNVAVALISQNGSDTDYYEIIIGSDNNLKTELKRCVESVCYTVLSEDTPYVLKSIKKTLFFIEVIPYPNGVVKIRIGKGDVLDIESTMLLSYEDSDPLKIEYIGIRTYGVWGEWTIHHKILLPEDLTSFQTTAGEPFHYISLAHHENSLAEDARQEGVSRFEFAVTTQSPVTVSISALEGEEPDRYEIRIGIESNMKLSLHHCAANNCTLLETALEYNVLNLNRPSSFFLELSTVKGGALFVRLGKVGGIDEKDKKLLLYTVLRPLRISFVGFRTPYSGATWVINQFIRYDSGTTRFATEPSQNYAYQLGPFHAGDEARIDFSVQSVCPAEMVFTSTTKSASDNYTIAIGTEHNQVTTVTKCVSQECTQLHVIATPDVLSPIFPAFFFMDIVCRDGTMSGRLGKASLAGSLRTDGSTLLMFEDSDPIHVTYAGFRTTQCVGVWMTSLRTVGKPGETTTAAIVEPTSLLPQENEPSEQDGASEAPSALKEEPGEKVIFTTAGAEDEPFRYEVGPLDPQQRRIARFEFLVAAPSDAIVALSPAVSSHFPSYKLHIGANENTETHVMRCLSQFYCPAKLTVQTDAILDNTGAVKFFVELVRCGRTNKLLIRLGLISGTAGVDSVVLDYEDADPLEIGWAGFGTLHGSMGEWTVYRFIFYSGTILISFFKTGQVHSNLRYPQSYTVLRDQDEMKFMFSVAAEQNALIALSGHASSFDATDVVQIRFGVDNNQKSTISRNNVEIVSAEAGHLSQDRNATFWVSVDGTMIEVGAKDSDPFMVANLETPIDAKYIWFVSGENERAAYDWMFYKYYYYSATTGHLESTHDIDIFHAHIYEQSALEETFEYSFHPLHENYFGKYMAFSVRTEGAISIALSADESGQQSDMYEVVFSGDGNTDVSIRRCSSCDALVSSHKEGGYLDPGEDRSFLISVYDGTVRLFDEHETETLLEWTDPEPLPVNFAGFSLKSSSHFTYATVPAAGSYTDAAPSPYFYAVQLFTAKPWKVIFSTSGQQRGEVYDIVYGALGNTRSEIRRGNIPLASAENAGLVSAEDPYYYWFAVEDTVILTGLFDPVSSQRCAPFLRYQDPEFISVSLFRISTGDADAVFNFGFGSGLNPQLEIDDEICAPYAQAVSNPQDVDSVMQDVPGSDGESASREKRNSNEERSYEEKRSSEEKGSSAENKSSEEKGNSKEEESTEDKRSSEEKGSSEEKKSSKEKESSEEKRTSEEKDEKKKRKRRKKGSSEEGDK